MAQPDYDDMFRRLAPSLLHTNMIDRILLPTWGVSFSLASCRLVREKVVVDREFMYMQLHLCNFTSAIFWIDFRASSFSTR